jgi:DHA1 family bicyclomycin/chloramphenicol resistance-like MFS transporter
MMAGTMAPLTLTRAISLAPESRGSASGIYGSSQLMIGALGVTIASAGMDVALASAVALVICTGTGFFIFLGLRSCRNHDLC